jgi:hypothetical protein
VPSVQVITIYCDGRHNAFTLGVGKLRRLMAQILVHLALSSYTELASRLPFRHGGAARKPDETLQQDIPHFNAQGYDVVHFSDGYSLYKRTAFQREAYFIIRRTPALSLHY